VQVVLTFFGNSTLKPMKLKLFATLLPLALLVSNGYAQYYTVEAQTGFGIGIPGATYGYYSTLRYSAAWGHVVDELNGVSKSLGQGIPINIELGYTGVTGLSFGISSGYQHGLTTSTKYGTKYYDDEDVREAKHQGRYFHISPYLGMYKRWKRWGFTVRLYPLFALPSFKVTTDIQLPDESNGTKGDHFLYVREFKGPLSVGFKGSFDIEHIFKSEKQAIFFGFNYSHLSFSPKTSEITTYDMNGHDDMSSLTDNNRLAEYSNDQEITYDFNPDGSINWNQDDDKPHKGYKFDVPFDAFAFTIGVRFYFNRPNKALKEDKPPL
jgi:hypothetical protein